MVTLFLIFAIIYAGAQVIEPVKERWLVSTPKPGAPEFFSGGAFGPEASLPAMVVGTSVPVVVLWMARRKGMFKARPDATPQVAAAV